MYFRDAAQDFFLVRHNNGAAAPTLNDVDEVAFFHRHTGRGKFHCITQWWEGFGSVVVVASGIFFWFCFMSTNHTGQQNRTFRANWNRRSRPCSHSSRPPTCISGCLSVRLPHSNSSPVQVKRGWKKRATSGVQKCNLIYNAIFLNYMQWYIF